MIGQLWHRLVTWLAPSAPPKPVRREGAADRTMPAETPFVHEMQAYRAEGIQQTRASLRAQRRDRVRRELLPIETGLFDDGEDDR